MSQWCRVCGLAEKQHPRFDHDFNRSKRFEPDPAHYRKLTGSELERELAQQLNTPMEGRALEVTAFGDANRSWLMPDRAMGSHVVTSNAATYTGDIINSTNTFDMGGGVSYTLEQSYLHKPDGSVKAIGPTKVREGEKSVGRETDLQWLRRRVAEIMWVPA